MSTFKINKEEVFKSNTDSFSVAATTSGYTLSYSVDGITWTDYTQATPANENLMEVNVPMGVSFKLKGNNDNNVMVILW